MSAAVHIHWTSRYDYEPGWHLDIHDHTYYQIIHIVDGLGMFYFEERQIEIKPQLTFLIQPNERHGLVAPDDTRIKTLDIKFDLYDSELCSHIKRLGGRLVVECAETKCRLEAIRFESITRPLYYKEIGSLELLRLLYSLARTAGRTEITESEYPASETDAVENVEKSLPERIKDYIRENYARPLDLGVISSALGYNKSYICHAFKRHCGTTPMRYLNEYRINRAKELIRDTDYDLKHIARIIGFRSIHHFHRVFTDMTKTTPGSFRESERLGIRRDIFVDESFHNTDYTQKKAVK